MCAGRAQGVPAAATAADAADADAELCCTELELDVTLSAVHSAGGRCRSWLARCCINVFSF